jgi:hypothetical protein
MFFGLREQSGLCSGSGFPDLKSVKYELLEGWKAQKQVFGFD